MRKRSGMIIAAVVAVALLLAVILWLVADKTDTVGICFRDSAAKENTDYRNSIRQALIAQGFEVIMTDADSDQTKQLQKIAELADKKCDILLIEPVMQDAAEDLLKTIADTKLPAVLFDRQMDTALLEQYPQIAYIGADEAQPGLLQAQLMSNLPAGGDLNGDGTVSYILIQGPQDHYDTLTRTASFEKGLLDSTLVVQQLASDNGDWTQDSGRKLCKQQLAGFGKDIEVIVCGNDQMALGAVQAIEDGGRTVGEDIYLLAIGGSGDALKMISEGKISGTVFIDPELRVKAIAETVLAKFREEPVDAVRILPYTTVTTENIKQYLEN